MFRNMTRNLCHKLVIWLSPSSRCWRNGSPYEMWKHVCKYSVLAQELELLVANLKKIVVLKMRVANLLFFSFSCPNECFLNEFTWIVLTFSWFFGFLGYVCSDVHVACWELKKVPSLNRLYITWTQPQEFSFIFVHMFILDVALLLPAHGTK